jgi:hypothetical protein
MKILVAYDGSDCANAALEDLHCQQAFGTDPLTSVEI